MPWSAEPKIRVADYNVSPPAFAYHPLDRGIFLLHGNACSFVSPDCIPFNDAKDHIGEIRCVRGKVIRVERGERGVHYLDFCEGYRICPFTVVVFAGDLKHVGHVRALQGRAGWSRCLVR